MIKVQTALILAGGKGTRFSEYTDTIPKPMIEANGKPLLIHIMNIYIRQGVKKFIVLTGYKSDFIFNYFKNDSQFNFVNDLFESDQGVQIKILDTGIETQTGGRIKKALQHIKEDHFHLTYGDGVADVDIKKLEKFHFENETIATLTAVRPPARFGSLEIGVNNLVNKFGEKNNSKEGWINGGFFILNKEIEDFIESDETPLEQKPLEQLALKNQLKAFQHSGYWRPVDTIRELELLEKEMKEKLFNHYE